MRADLRSKRPKLAYRSCVILSAHSFQFLKRALNFYVTELWSGLDLAYKNLLKDPVVYFVHIPAKYLTRSLICSHSTGPLQVQRHNP